MTDEEVAERIRTLMGLFDIHPVFGRLRAKLFANIEANVPSVHRRSKYRADVLKTFTLNLSGLPAGRISRHGSGSAG